jgi:hypothetical protein
MRPTSRSLAGGGTCTGRWTSTGGSSTCCCPRRDTAAARRFFVRALRDGPAPVEVTTDKAAAYLRVLDVLAPAAVHVTEQYANNRMNLIMAG